MRPWPQKTGRAESVVAWWCLRRPNTVRIKDTAIKASATALAAWRYCWQARSYARTVHGIKRDYPDQRDKSERYESGQRHKLLLPVVGLWTESRSQPSLSHSRVLTAYDLRNSPGSLAILLAIL